MHIVRHVQFRARSPTYSQTREDNSQIKAGRNNEALWNLEKYEINERRQRDDSAHTYTLLIREPAQLSNNLLGGRVRQSGAQK